MGNLQKFLRKNYLLILILFVTFFFRLYKAKELFLYSHDQDLIGWFIKDVVENKHLRLIGQETSSQGMFVGSLFYYLLIPFYVLFKMDPIAGVYAVAVFSLFGAFSFYYIFNKIFGKMAGFVASFLYATNYFIILNGREVNPTQPTVFVWSLWYFYALWGLLKGKKYAYLLLGFLVGLVWHINMTLILLLPLAGIAILLSKKKFESINLVKGVIILAATSIPLVLFEIRHGFIQSKALFFSLITDRGAVVHGVAKFERTLHLAAKNTHALLLPPINNMNFIYSFIFLLFVIIVLLYKKILEKEIVWILAAWLVSYIGFFSIYSMTLSEYYLNGMQSIWMVALVMFFVVLLSSNRTKRLGVILLALFTILNIYRFFTQPVNKSGYVEKKALIAEIKRDAESHGYPCVAVSYITKPGYNLGYRYFFWQENMHVNQSKSESPVYSIVFPHSQVDRIDKSFGALGLIFPDYERYNKKDVTESCSGENANLTDPLFGFTD